MDKYKIEKNTVQETLMIPLYGRRLCSQQFPGLFQDKSAAELMDRIDYDFSELEKQSGGLMQGFVDIDGKSAGTMKTNLGGKLSLSVELEGADAVAIRVEKR